MLRYAELILDSSGGMSLSSLKLIGITSDGIVRSIRQEENQSLFHELGVTFFDLRILDPNLFAMQSSGLSGSNYLSRHQSCIVAKIGTCGLICTQFALYLTEGGGSDNKNLIDDLCRRISVTRPQRPDSHSADEKEFSRKTTSTAIPNKSFVTTVLESVLDSHILKIEIRINHLEHAVTPLLHNLESSFVATDFARLKVFKSRIAENANLLNLLTDVLEKFLEENRSGNDDVLDRSEQEDLCMLMHIYQVKSSLLSATLDQILTAMTESENYFTMRSDAQRNQILKFELMVSCISFAILVISAVSGLLGMNLDNSVYMPEIHGLFIYVTVITGVISIALFLACMWYFRHVRLF